MIGQGVTADPKRPMYTPVLVEGAPAPATNFLGFISVQSDDGTMALVEFVADNVSAFKPILTDPTVRSFLKGRDSRQAAETAFQAYKKGFSIANFGLRIP